MGLIKRVKNWLLPQTANDPSSTVLMPMNGVAVAGFVQRLAADVEIIPSSNITRPLAGLLPPAVAAAPPLRLIPMFLVASAAEPADVEIIHNARPPAKLLLVHNVDRVVLSETPTANYMLAARLASVAHLNSAVGKKPFKQPQPLSAKTANRPTTKPTLPIKTATSSKSPKCYVRPQATGQAIVVAVRRQAKRRAG